MSFDTVESSVQDSAPVELLKFTVQGRTEIVRLTTHSSDVTHLGEVYKASTFTRTQLNRSREKNSDSITFKLPFWEPEVKPLADAHISNAPSGRVLVLLYKMQVGSSPITYIQEFDGFVAGAAFEQDHLELLCKGVRNVFNKEGPRLTWMVGCNHELYDAGCALLEADFTETNIAVTAVSADGLSITLGGLTERTSPAYADNVFKGGKLVIGDGTEYRTVVDQTGDVLKIRYPLINVYVGASVDVSMGCLHTLRDCKDKFNNLVNYGGVPYSPNFNPFEIDIDRY